MSMFCYQCQETAMGTGCTLKGVCGKTSEVVEKLNEHRANSKKKENVQDITFDTTGSYGSKTKE